MLHNDGASISRATSISRASKAGSTRSRAASLAQKASAPSDLRPSDVLIERFTAWKAIVKQLLAYFEGIADIENNTARELTKLGAVIQVPFRAGNQFLGEGGLQDVFYSVRDRTRTIADEHANLGRTIDSSIVQHLHKLLAEIKAHIKNIQNDTGKLATTVAKERELSAKLIGELATSISVFKSTPMRVGARADPYVTNAAVVAQLTKQVHAENALQKSIIIMQQNSAHFETGLVRAIQSSWATFNEWQSRMSTSVQETWRVMAQHMAALEADREWISFSARSDQLVDPETPLRSAEKIKYPSMEDPSVLAVHTGYLERKKRYTRTYREAYYVLTPAGFLHEYTSSDPTSGTHPVFSLFLPACTLGPPSSARALSGSHKFHIELSSLDKSTGKTGSIRKRMSTIGRSSSQAYTFRARNHSELMEWWNDIRMLCNRYLVASESVERGGPVMAAVRAAGYESEEEGSDEEGGSSVEEDEDDKEEADAYEDATDDDREPAPEYSSKLASGPGSGSGIRRYTLEDKPIAGGSAEGGADEDDMARRPSRRQKEKAPEGREPHGADGDGADDAGAAPMDGDADEVASRGRQGSRFRETA